MRKLLLTGLLIFPILLACTPKHTLFRGGGSEYSIVLKEGASAVALQPAGKGVRYTRYEGDFLSTDQMLREGRVVERGTGPCIAIDTRPEADHFGYVFEALLEAPAEGLYQFRVTSDDGTVLLLDGKRILELDGSHSPETGFCYAVLEKGFHRLELRYFEDCEGQVLDASLTGPDGKLLPLSQWGLFLDECL